MDEILETYENGTRKLEIYSNGGDNIFDPRTHFDNLGTMACFHRRYNLGDKVDISIEESQKIENDVAYISLPLYLYDHSGITISTSPFSCHWDSGKVGIIYVSKEIVRKEFNWKVITKARKERIISYLESEVETYEQYSTGDIYGYTLYENNVEVDSCNGFYGSDHKKSGLFDAAGWEE